MHSVVPVTGVIPALPSQLLQKPQWDRKGKLLEGEPYCLEREGQPQPCCSSPSCLAWGPGACWAFPRDQDAEGSGFCGELDKCPALGWLREHVICGMKNCVCWDTRPKTASFWRELTSLEGHSQYSWDVTQECVKILSVVHLSCGFLLKQWRVVLWVLLIFWCRIRPHASFYPLLLSWQVLHNHLLS